MFMGKGPWEENGPLYGRLLRLTTGEPRSYTNAKGELKGPYTTFGFLNPADENIAVLLKPELDAWWSKKADEEALVASASNGGLGDDDDLPF